MLIPIKSFLEKHGIKIRGVAQIGTHYAQEHPAYIECGIKKFLYVEPCKEPFAKLQSMFGANPDVILYNVACADYNGKTDMFTSRQAEGQSNSLLPPKLHLKEHAEVVFDGKETVDVRRLDDLQFDKGAYNLLNVDVQGAEHLVLAGATETLKHIDVVYLEINRGEMYEGCVMVEQIDAILKDYDRIETSWAGNFSWGDGIYLRRNRVAVEPPVSSESTESKPEQAELVPEQKIEEPVKPSFEVHQPQYHLQAAGVYDELCKANLADKVIYAMGEYQRQITRDKMSAMQREVLGTCRFDIKFWSDKYSG